MQEALIKTYRYVGRIREPEAFRPWLYRTVRNACLMGRRKKVGEPARLQSLDDVLPGRDGSTRPDAPDPGKNPEQLADNAGLRRRLRKALRTLPGPYRAIVFLREMEGLSTREVAKVMGMSEDNVKTRLHRARVQLQARLGERREMTVPTRPSARCRALLLELSRYLDGDLTPARRRTVERHINACACCGTMAARLRRTVAACRAEGKRQPPRAVMSRAAERIRALVARERPTASRDRSASTARIRLGSALTSELSSRLSLPGAKTAPPEPTRTNSFDL